MPALLVLHGTGGRLGNRLMLQAHLMSFCIEHPPWRLVNFNFVPYAHFFEQSWHHPWMVYPPGRARAGPLVRAVTPPGIALSDLRKRLPPRWAYRVSVHGARLTHRLLGRRARLLEWGDGRTCDLGSPQFAEWAVQFGWVVLGGFLFRDWRALEEHQQAIRQFLRPAREYADPARDLLADLRRRHRVVIGVLVRRTDYARWLDGRFQFDLTQYRDWLVQLVRIFGPDAGLLIATDDPEAASLAAGLPARLSTGAAGQGGHYMESVSALSMCDAIASPPSTFAAMAAFLGGVPILPLCDRGQQLRPSDLLHRHLFDAVEHPEFGRAVS